MTRRPHSDRGHRPAVDAQLPFPQLRVDPPRPCLCCSAIRCDAEECREALLDALVPHGVVAREREPSVVMVRIALFLNIQWRITWERLARIHECSPKRLRARAGMERTRLGRRPEALAEAAHGA